MSARVVRLRASFCRAAVASAAEHGRLALVWGHGSWCAGLRELARVGSIMSVFAVALQSASADGSGVMDRARPEYDPIGIPLGAFRLFPAVEAVLAASDNALQTTAPQDDVSVALAPAFKLTSQWSQHSLEIFGNLNATRYSDLASEDVTDWAVGATGRVDIQRDCSIAAGVSTARAHEGRSSPNAPGDLAEPISYNVDHADVGLAFQPNRFRVAIGAEIDRYVYEDALLNGGGILDNSDRDRDEFRAHVRGSLELSDGYLGFIEAAYDKRDFDRALDRAGVNRDSHGTSINGGVEFRLVDFLQGEVLVGYLDRRFGAPLDDFSGFNYGARLKWSATVLTTVHLRAARVLDETTVAGSALVVDNRFGIGVDHELRRNLILQAGIEYVDSDFVGSGRSDTQLEASARATYLIDNSLSATAGYERRERDSSVPNEDFTEDKFHVGLRFQL